MHRWPLIVLPLSLAACGADPAEVPAETPAETPAEAAPAEQDAASEPFVPPADAKVLKLGEPRMMPIDPTGKGSPFGPPEPRVTCTSSYDVVVKRFGEAKLRDHEVALGEGETASGTIVAEGSPVAQEIVWADAERSRPERIRVLGDGIRDPQGLGLGSTLAELEAAIGPFDLAGFEWDYGGTVMLKGTRLEKLEGRVFFRLEPRNTDTAEGQAALTAAIGDELFASSDANVKILDPVVGEFLMVCPTQ